MKKNCNKCRALTSNGCSLGYKTLVTSYSFNGHVSERKPLEECPKPKTYKDYIKYLNQ